MLLILTFNQITSIINALSILVLLVYWIVSARLVKQKQEKAGGIGNYGHIILISVAAVIMNIKVYPFTLLLFSFSRYAGILSIFFSISGLIIAIAARRYLAANWSMAVTFKKDHQLITAGPYKYVRHPIYSGVLLILLGTVFALGSLGAVAGFIIIFVTFCLKLRQEEGLLTKHFGEEYLEYKKRSKALIPFLW